MMTSNIQKGGALLDDTRRLVEAWSEALGVEENLERVIGENLLGKPSRTRAEDVVRRIIKPRFVAPGPHVISALGGLLAHSAAFREACYLEAADLDAVR